jgi:predicted nucleotidyltransferase
MCQKRLRTFSWARVLASEPTPSASPSCRMTMLSTSDAASGARLSARVQTYIEALVHTCTQDRTPLVSVALFGSAAKGGFSGDVSDVDVIIVVSDELSRAKRLRLGEDIARLETLHELRPATTHSPGSVRARIERAVGHGISCFVCTRSDLISGDVARVLDLRPWEAPFVDRIVFASIIASAATVWGSAARPVVDTGVISQSTAHAVAALARRIAETQGGPQDVEWALDRAEVIILQARPIAGLPLAPALDIPPGRWINDSIHWSGPMTPVGASILSPLVETMLAEVFAEFGVPLERMLMRSFGGEIYMQEIEIGGKHNSGPPPPWWLGAIAFRCVPPLRRVATTARQALPKLEAYPRAWEESWRAECSSRIEKARAVDLRRLDDEALAGHLDQLVAEVLTPNLRVHFRLVLPDIVALHDLAVCCREHLGWDDGQMLQLLAGLSATVTEPALELAEIAELAGSDAVMQGLGAVRATSAGPRLDEWLNCWGSVPWSSIPARRPCRSRNRWS